MGNESNAALPENATCPAIGYQAVNVNVPITVTPFAQAGATVTRCCGAPVVKSGKSIGEGTKNGICNFTIGQNIMVAIPVAFGAEATVGDTYVDALGAFSEDLECEALENIDKPNQPETIASNEPTNNENNGN